MNTRKFLDLIFEQNLVEVSNIISRERIKDLNFVYDKLNVTPLICAIDSGNSQMVELILANGANPNYLNEGLSLPLYYTIEIAEEAEDSNSDGEDELLEIIKLLVKYGADFHFVNFDGKTPYEYASSRYQKAKIIFDNFKH